MQGDAKQMQQKLQAEIEELKKQLSERTGQLEVASNTILERNEEVQKLRMEIKTRIETIEAREQKIIDLEKQLQDALNSGAEGEEKLRQEIQRLLQEIEKIKAQAK